MVTTARVGVLSLQGDFARHRDAIEALGVEARRVTLPRDLEAVAALVIPGGESTTLLRLVEATGLRAPLERFVRERPVMGTCAGVILLGRDAARLPYATLGALDVATERNAYGRQIDSFVAELDVPVLGGRFEGVFIRAPRLARVGPGVEIIARRPLAGGAPPEIVGVRERNVVGLCFHPELTADRRLHRWFLRDVAGFPLSHDPAAVARSPRHRGARVESA